MDRDVTVLGVENSGRLKQKLHDHLLKQGFHRTFKKNGPGQKVNPCYFREDLGVIQFVCPQIRLNQKVSTLV